MIGVSPLAENGRIQLNVRISKETSDKLDEIVEYYQENLRLGRVYKGDVLTDIIEKSHELMNKQKKGIKRY
jgi:hypothetical protein